MGIRQRWLACRGKSREEIFASLHLRPTGTYEKIGESPLVGADLPDGWYVVIANRSGHPLINDAAMKQLSDRAELVCGDVEEHVMVSTAEGWRDGVRTWVVMHDAQRDIRHLETQGDFPQDFEKLRDALLKEQQVAGGADADVDFTFDIPVEWARKITGYRHDAVFPSNRDAPFEVLSPSGDNPSRERPFWKHFFGR